MNKEERIDYLENERKKIWEKIIILEELLSKKTSDFENEAKLSSEQALLFKSTSEEAKISIIENLEEANSKLQEIRTIYNSFEVLNKKINEYSNISKENSEEIQTIYDTIQNKTNIFQNQIAEIEKIFENKPILDEKLIKLEGIFIKGDDYDSKLNILNKSITDRKKEIDELYYEIIGYTENNDEGVETEVKGLKNELQNSYTQIKLKLEELEKEFVILKTNAKLDYTEFTEKNENIFIINLKIWEEKYSKIEKTITELLPRALTTGLSYAYSEKKLSEEKENEKFSSTFKWAIGGLIAVSLIPFLISIKSIFDKTTFEEVILRIPRLVLAILPLYIPVLWVAYSSNRKMNLSKRLSEEYSHKEVLVKHLRDYLSKLITLMIKTYHLI